MKGKISEEARAILNDHKASLKLQQIMIGEANDNIVELNGVKYIIWSKSIQRRLDRKNIVCTLPEKNDGKNARSTLYDRTIRRLYRKTRDLWKYIFA